MKILIINGPNLNMLGMRKKQYYGTETLGEVNDYIVSKFPDVDISFYQSNHEGDLVDVIQTTNADGVVINAGAYTHYSIAIRDAIECRTSVPFVEVHLSDIKKREPFRAVSYLTDVCKATFAGYGKESYIKGVEFLLKYKDE